MYGELLKRLRNEAPLVQCLTNYVAMDLSANVLLAVGASPAMVHAREEAGEFAGLASAVVLNIGTLSPPWVEAMHDTARVARSRGRPVVLDPVAAGATTYRRETSAALLDTGVDVVRGNASEIRALAGGAAAGRGVDATDPVEAALEAASELARSSSCVVATTGVRDLLTDGKRVIEVRGGHPIMTRVTAIGCALSSLVGAFAAITDDRLDATTAALATMKICGKKAAFAGGPGSFLTALLDALYALEPEELDAPGVVAELAAP
jgi:hydroxyethylthiazole kinase